MVTDMTKPCVTVLMSVFNGQIYLKEAIDSILNQTYTNFEFVIINDASTDDSEQIIHSYHDKRIKYSKNHINLGLAASLNKGINLSSGEYIARMDADDISINTRLARQVDFLEENPHIVLVGSWFKIIGSGYIVKPPTSKEDVKIDILFNNPLAHPSVMFRKQDFVNQNLYYDETLNTSQDQELWYRVSKELEIANMPQVLLNYRVHDNQVSSAKKEIQRKNRYLIKKKIISDFLGDKLGAKGFAKFISLKADEKYSFFPLSIWIVLLRLYFRNKKKKVYDEAKFNARLIFLLKKSIIQNQFLPWKSL